MVDVGQDTVLYIQKDEMLQSIDDFLELLENLDLERGHEIELPDFPCRRPPTEKEKRNGDSVTKYCSTTGLIIYYGFTKPMSISEVIIVKGLLNIIKKLLRDDEPSNIARTYYYLLKNDTSFTYGDSLKPRMVEKALTDLCCYFKCTRKSLKISYTSAGTSFGGCVRYTDIGLDEKMHTTDCSIVLKPHQLHLETIRSIEASPLSTPKFILILEKYAVFESLIQNKFTCDCPCVLVTGSGQPTIECRTFVKMLYDSLEIPVFAFVDFNPYGIDIMRSYKVGSYSHAFESGNLCVPSIEFIGLSSRDLIDYEISDSDLTKVPETDKKFLSTVKYLLKEPWLINDEELFESLNYNFDNMIKADIEVVLVRKGIETLRVSLLAKIRVSLLAKILSAIDE